MLNEMMRNGSGYPDFTAYNGMTKANHGEVWTQVGKEDELFLLIAINGKVCTALKLTARESDGSIPVSCHGQMYTHPGMLRFIFANQLDGYVYTMPKKEFEDVRKAVADVLGFAMPGNPAEIKPQEEWVPTEVQEKLEKQLEVAQIDLNVQKNNNSMLCESITQMELDLAACKPYKLMYLELLDKLIAKVGAAL